MPPPGSPREAATREAYLYCPECGCTLPARNALQAAHMLHKTRPDRLAEAGQAAPPEGAALLANKTGKRYDTGPTQQAGRAARCDPVATMAAHLVGLGPWPQ